MISVKQLQVLRCACKSLTLIRPRKMNAAMVRMAAAAMKDPKAIAYEVAKQLHITTATLYTYVNPDGSLKDAGKKLVSL